MSYNSVNIGAFKEVKGFIEAGEALRDGTAKVTIEPQRHAVELFVKIEWVNMESGHWDSTYLLTSDGTVISYYTYTDALKEIEFLIDGIS